MAMPVIGLTKLFISETIGSIIRFPIWWYTDGLIETVRWCMRGLRFRWQSAGLSVWLANFFVPMYGQHDLAGRLVSVVMRFVVLVGRSVGLLVESIGYLILLMTWIFLPIVCFLMFVQSIVFSGFRT